MGRLYWITGLAGAGKSSLANELFRALKPGNPKLVILDGDSLREFFAAKGQYEKAARHQLAMRYARLCHLLTNQSIDVICATISMFDDVRSWNRKHNSNYVEIYHKVPFSVLRKRDKNNLYSDYASQKTENVVGCDIDAQLPKQADIVLYNNGDNTIEELLQQLLKEL